MVTTPPGWERLRWSLTVRRALKAARRALRRVRARARRPDHRPIATSATARACLAGVTLAYIGGLSYLTLRNHYGFGTTGFDIGIFDQGVWLLSRLHSPFVTVRGLHLFGDHTSFVLLALVPFYWVMPSPAVLLGVQSLALGAGAIPAYLIGRAKLRSEWCAFACALAYLAHPAVAWTNFENFHPDSFEVPLVLWAFYFVFTRRWRWFVACVAAALLVKEDVGLLTVVLGLYVAWHHHRDVGLATAAVSAAWSLTALFVVLPAFNEEGSLYGSRLTAQFGGIRGFAQTLVTRPWEIASLALGPAQRWYLWQLTASFGLLSLLAPAVLLIAAGPLLVNLLSSFPYQHQLRYHYSTLIVPVLTVSAIVGIASFRSLRVRGILAAVMAVAAVTSAYLWGPVGREPAPVADPSTPQAQAARAAIGMIPPDAAVSASYTYVPHLAHRRQIYEFPNPWRATNWGNGTREGTRLPFADDIDYLLVTTSVRNHPEGGAIIRRLEGREFEVLFDSEGVVLLGRSREAGG